MDKTTPPLENTQANPPKKGEVGNIVTADTIMSYSCTFSKTVCVSARKNTESLWDFEGVCNGELVIRGEIIGGKWKAAQYAKFIRNGLLSRSNRRHGKKDKQ
jgi:hypothetical protein